MKAIFMGTPEFSVHALNTLYNSGFEISLVITQPDKKQGRKQEIIFSPVKERALELGLEIRQYNSIKSKEAIGEILAIKPDLIIVSAYGQILPAEILHIPKFGCINVHASILPKYRGASPINHALLNGDSSTGITTMQMDEGMDTGDIILQDEIQIELNDNAETLTKKLATLSEKTLSNTLSLIQMNMPLPNIQQNEQQVTYSPMIKKEDGLIDFSDEATSIINQIKAFVTWPVAYTFYEGKRFKIYSAKDTSLSSEAPPGTIVRFTEDSIVVATGTTEIQLLEVQLEGKKRMHARTFLLGNPLEKGKQFNKSEK